MSELKSYGMVADHKRALFEADTVMRYNYTAITPLSTNDVSKQSEIGGVDAIRTTLGKMLSFTLTFHSAQRLQAYPICSV